MILQTYALVYWPDDEVFGDAFYIYNITTKECQSLYMGTPNTDWINNMSHGFKSIEDMKKHLKALDEAPKNKIKGEILDIWEE